MINYLDRIKALLEINQQRFLLYSDHTGEPLTLHRKVTTCARVQGASGEKVPSPVPAVIPETDEEKREYEEAIRRREYREIRRREHF